MTRRQIKRLLPHDIEDYKRALDYWQEKLENAKNSEEQKCFETFVIALKISIHDLEKLEKRGDCLPS